MPDSGILTPKEIERRAAAAGLSVAELCRRTGIAHTTFNRWRNGENEPQLAVYRRILQVLRAAEKNPEPKPPAAPKPARKPATKRRQARRRPLPATRSAAPKAPLAAAEP